MAAIRHGGQPLAATGLMKGLTMTGHPRTWQEMEAASSVFANRKVVVDGKIIISRVSDDPPAFNAALKEMLPES